MVSDVTRDGKFVTPKIDFLTKEGAEKSRPMKKGDFIIAVSGQPGQALILDVDACIHDGFAGLRDLDESKVSKDYLYHFMNFAKEKNSAAAAGAIFKNLTTEQIRELEIPLPYPDDPEKSLKEQKRIAAILDKADGIRRKRQQAIQLADDFLRSVFLDMFGDPVTNPKGWEEKIWSECLRIVNGKNQKKVESEDGSYPICGSGGVMARADDWLVEKNSVIIGRKGNINSPILMKERFWNVDTAFGLEPKHDLLSHNYLFWFCKFFNFERLNKAVTIPSLTKADLLNVKLPIPKLSVQKEFDDIVTKLDSYLGKAFDFESNKSFEALSQQAFKGEL